MGGVVYFVPLTRGPSDEAQQKALLETVWGVLKRRIDSLAKRKGLRDITGAYLAMEAGDGLMDGSWFADTRNITFSFGDAAGLCVGEADASWHWTELVALEMWDVLAESARLHGAELGPRPRSLEAALAKNDHPIWVRLLSSEVEWKEIGHLTLFKLGFRTGSGSGISPPA